MSAKKTLRSAYLPAIVLAVSGTTVSAQDGSSDSWKWRAEVYGWGASLGGRATTGSDIDIGIDKIIDDLKFGFMGAVDARKGNWRLFADLIYLDIGENDKAGVNVGGISVPVSASIDLKGVISTAGVGYRVYERPGRWLDVTGGIRYLWLDSHIKVNVGALSLPEKDSGSNWDAVVGLQGTTNLTDKWYLDFIADVGAGDSDLTWQAIGAVGYRMEKVNLVLGYRYMDWDFDNYGPFDDLNLSGPFAGVKIPL